MSTEKKIEDYLHLYLGCEVMTDSGVARLVHVGLLGNIGQRFHTLYAAASVSKEWKDGNILILRPLSDMTGDEKKDFINVVELEPEDISCVEFIYDDIFGESFGENPRLGTAHLTDVFQWAKGVHYLLSKHFDLFGLIEAGLAIDKTKIPQP